MESQVRDRFLERGEASVPELVDSLDGDIGDVFLATRALYHDGVLVRTGPLRYRVVERRDADAVADESGFVWNPPLEG